MMVVEVRTQKTALGKAEVVNQGLLGNGEDRYAVKWTGPHGEILEFEVRHDRKKGAWALAEKVCRKAKKELARFYSYPADKVVDGLIRDSDVPKRYKKAFGKWLGICTVSMMERRPCPGGCLDANTEKKSETAYNIGDLTGFLDAMLYGRRMLWD